jgi:hypothetical protein
LHPATKDQLHLFRTAQIDVFAAEFLEELEAAIGAIPDLGEGELRLEDRQLIAAAGASVLGAVGAISISPHHSTPG